MRVGSVNCLLINSVLLLSCWDGKTESRTFAES